ncbi:hypothetical protein OPQ81_008477 [Rhizoctonia solani]|nr:hypothetical protein OPQ81_008477 [Rhizoctonia solani]
MILLLLLVSAHGAYATRTCGYDFEGRYWCSGVSNAARLGIGIGIAALTMLAFVLIIMLRRRRLRQAKEVYVQHPIHGQYQTQPHYPHYPPQQYPTQPSYDPSQQWSNNQQGGWNAPAPTGNYHPDNQSHQYAPRPGAPPSYSPPAHPPPTKEHV